MATKVTAAQRKHGLQSLMSLHGTKTQKLANDFNNNPENKPRMVPSPVTPNSEEILKALVGLDSTVTLKISKEDFVRQHSARHVGMVSFYPHMLANAINQAEIDEVMVYNEGINQRRRQEVDGRNVLITDAYRRACDVVALADSGDDILRVIQEFEAREF